MAKNGDWSAWNVPDDYATQFMTYEAAFCAREAIEARNRGCDDRVVNHYKRRAELLEHAIGRVKASEKAYAEAAP